MADTAENDGTKDEEQEQQHDDTEASKAEVEKWKALARKHEERAKANAEAAKRLAEIEDANKSDSEKVAERLAAAEKRASEAEAKALRFEVAAAKKVPPRLLKFLSGSTEEELGASADELLAAMKPDTGEEQEHDGGGAGPTGRPQERLRAGSVNDEEPEETDPAKLAAQIPRA